MASVDVVVPCYQYGRYLRSCVRSVLEQEVEGIRILIVDNASTDNSLEEAQQLAAEERAVEVVAHKTNRGAHASFNEGIDWAHAEYFMILCADDLLAPGALLRAMSVMEGNANTAFALGTDVEYREGFAFPVVGRTQAKWRIVNGMQFIEECCRNPARYLALGSILVRTQAQKKAGYYRKDLSFTDDFEMVLRLARLGCVAQSRAIQGIRRLHKENASKRQIASRTHELVYREAAIESFFAHEGAAIPDARRLRRLARRRLAERAYWWGMREAMEGFGSAAFDLFKFAFRRCPAMVILPPVGHLIRNRLLTGNHDHAPEFSSGSS